MSSLRSLPRSGAGALLLSSAPSAAFASEGEPVVAAVVAPVVAGRTRASATTRATAFSAVSWVAVLFVLCKLCVLGTSERLPTLGALAMPRPIDPMEEPWNVGWNVGGRAELEPELEKGAVLVLEMELAVAWAKAAVLLGARRALKLAPKGPTFPMTPKPSLPPSLALTACPLPPN